jgi:hypothetical protein
VYNVYKISVGKRKRPLGRHTSRWEDNIRMDLREIGWEDVDWMHLDEDRDQWQAVANRAMNLRFPQQAGNFLIRKVIISFSRRTLLRGVNVCVGFSNALFKTTEFITISSNIANTKTTTIIVYIVSYGCETWSLTIREQILRVSDKEVLRRTFGPNKEAVTGGG